jgi:putative endonuclease
MPRWHVYIVRCRDGALYTGVATDISRRLAEHEQGAGKGAKYLRGRGPLRLVLDKTVGRRGLALRVEACIKRLPKARKEELIGQATLMGRIVTQALRRAPRRVRQAGSGA